MSIETVPGTDLKYYLIAFDADGQERQDDPAGPMSRLVLDALDQEPITDVFILSHGWKGDIPAAREQYARWILAMAQCNEDIEKMRDLRPGFRPLLIGLHWPSLPWGDENLSTSEVAFAPEAAQPIEQMIDAYAARIADTPRAREALQTIFEAARTAITPTELPTAVRSAYETLDQESGMSDQGEGAAPGNDREPFDPERAYQAALEEEEISFGKFSLGGLLSPLRQLSFWKMKDRARAFGSTGAHELLKRLQQQVTAPRRVYFHLMGHSFGCIVVSAMIDGPAGMGALPQPVDSAALIQGALSLWSYCPSIPNLDGEKPGYFHTIISGRKVRGPLITTQSKFDTAVGRYYPLGAGARRDVAFDTDWPKYGGLGTFGARGLPSGVLDFELQPATVEYNFQPGTIYNLNSNRYINEGDGASGAHSDIAKPEVAHAVWQAAYAAG